MLQVEASYQTNTKNLQGITIKSFQVSQTLTAWNAWLIAIQQDVGTVRTDVGLIKLNLTLINAKIIDIEGNIATINTDVGTIKADIETIQDLNTNQGTSLNVTMILSAIAAIGAIATLTLFLKRRKTV